MKLNISIPGVDETLVGMPYYHGLIPREDVTELLKTEGQFLLRVTEPKPGMAQSVVISVMAGGHQSKHFVIRQDKTTGRFHCERAMYHNIKALVDDYLLAKHGLDETGSVKLTDPVPRSLWEIENWTVDVGDKLGEGAFGAVCKGRLANKTPVAIKQMHMVRFNLLISFFSIADFLGKTGQRTNQRGYV